MINEPKIAYREPLKKISVTKNKPIIKNNFNFFFLLRVIKRIKKLNNNPAFSFAFLNIKLGLYSRNENSGLLIIAGRYKNNTLKY